MGNPQDTTVRDTTLDVTVPPTAFGRRTETDILGGRPSNEGGTAATPSSATAPAGGITPAPPPGQQTMEYDSNPPTALNEGGTYLGCCLNAPVKDVCTVGTILSAGITGYGAVCTFPPNSGFTWVLCRFVWKLSV